jgi:hypothetical protein
VARAACALLISVRRAQARPTSQSPRSLCSRLDLVRVRALVQIVCSASVRRITYSTHGAPSPRATGVELECGTRLESDVVLSGATP